MNIKEKILEFKTYKANWNGYDAESFSDKVIENALNLEKYLFYKKGFEPDIFPTAANSLQVEYEIGKDYLEIEIKENCFEIFKMINSKEETKEIALDKIYEVINEIKLFYQPKVSNLCLFTGAFNPISIAHFYMIDSANKAGNFDYIVFAISNQKFLDKKQRRAKDYAYSEVERLEFLLAATYKCPNVLIFGVEQGYTYEVLCAVKEKYKCESLYFALGSDKLKEIGRWGYHDKLLKEICFYILLRKDSLNVAKKKCDELFYQTKYIIGQDNEKYKDISSTLIRQKIKDKEDFSNLVCPEVYKLLIKRHSF